MPASKVEPWFDRFLNEHLARHPRVGLAAPESDQGVTVYATWRKHLERIEGIDYMAATAASERLMIEPAADKKHFTTLVSFAMAALRDRKPEGKRHDLTTREGAAAASIGCDRCAGTGLTTVWHPLPVPERRSPTAAAHCVCAHGRWIRRYYESTRDEMVLKGVIDLMEVLQGRSRWLAEQPDPAKYRPSAPF